MDEKSGSLLKYVNKLENLLVLVLKQNMKFKTNVKNKLKR
jgi:hypothetical protein